MSGWAQHGGFNPHAHAFMPSQQQGQYPQQQYPAQGSGGDQPGYHYPPYYQQQGSYNPGHNQHPGGYTPGYNQQWGGHNPAPGGYRGGYSAGYNQQGGGYNSGYGQQMGHNPAFHQQRYPPQQHDRAGQGAREGVTPVQAHPPASQQVEPQDQQEAPSTQTAKVPSGGGASDFVPPPKKAKSGVLSLPKKKVEETKPSNDCSRGGHQLKDATAGAATTAADDRKAAPQAAMKLTPEELRERVRSEIARQRKLNKKEFVRDPRPHFNIVFCGHVDAGKSTISGHLLMEKGLVDQREMDKLRREAEMQHREGWEYAYVMDVSEDERAKGITRETGAAYVETEKRRLTILDAPGHKAFVPSMIGGATQADVCVLVISSRTGEFETGFEKGGQTREHAMLVRTCGVKQMICVINKMDDVSWSKERYDAILGKLKPFLRQNGYDTEKAKNLIFIPIAGLTGENLIRKPAEGVCPWYDGPTMMSFIDELVLPETKSEDDVLCIPLVGSYKDEGRTFVYGKVESGSVAVGEKIQILPGKQEAVVEGISIEATEFEKCYPGDNVHLRVRGVDENDVHAGYVGTSVPTSLRAVEYFQARIVILDVKNIICAGSRVMLHAHAAQEEVSFHKLLAKLDKKTGEVVQKDPTHVKAGDVVIARMELERPLVLEPHKDFDKMGRFMLRDDGKTIAIGLVIKLYESTRESLANAGKA